MAAISSEAHCAQSLAKPVLRSRNSSSCCKVTIMLVGVPKEIKDSEYRVGLVPSTVRELTLNGHRAMVEQNAGSGAGITDADYQARAPRSWPMPIRSSGAPS